MRNLPLILIFLAALAVYTNAMASRPMGASVARLQPRNMMKSKDDTMKHKPKHSMRPKRRKTRPMSNHHKMTPKATHVMGTSSPSSMGGKNVMRTPSSSMNHMSTRAAVPPSVPSSRILPSASSNKTIAAQPTLTPSTQQRETSDFIINDNSSRGSANPQQGANNNQRETSEFITNSEDPKSPGNSNAAPKSSVSDKHSAPSGEAVAVETDKSNDPPASGSSGSAPLVAGLTVVGSIVVLAVGVLSFRQYRRKGTPDASDKEQRLITPQMISAPIHNLTPPPQVEPAPLPIRALERDSLPHLRTPQSSLADYQLRASLGPNIPRGPFPVIATFMPTLSDELDVQVGDEVLLIHEYDDGWSQCVNLTRGCTQGVVPTKCIGIPQERLDRNY
ncbi:uncharacterized protein VTP21DRAFT_2667 [Calcarisporiella thermophila]|uniref:uncharacterized protein n=1 Tax=Calcarisporiella thermophila TaxID=911321 RepID=UPI0037444C51